MECIIKINTEFEIKLSEKYNLISKENINLYHSKEYNLKVFFKTQEKEIENVKIYISGIEYPLNKNITSNNEVFFERKKERYFNCIWGYSRIILKVSFKNEDIFLYSNLLNIILDSNSTDAEKTENSIRKMVCFIMDNFPLLLKKETKNRYSIIEDKIIHSEFKNLYTEIEELKEIIECYLKNKSYFMRDQKYKIKSIDKIDSFEKIKNVNLNTIKHIITNPQELNRIIEDSAIQFYKWNYQPNKTLVNSTEYDYNILENKIVLGFLKSLLFYLDNRIKDTETILKNQLLKNKADIIKNIIKFYYQSYLYELFNIKNSLNDIYFVYKNFMKCEEIIVTFLPKFSEIFKNNHHYRNMYIVIEKWFNKGNYNLKNMEIFTLFTTVDKVYEYYCLIFISQALISLGFIAEKYFEYTYSNDKYSTFSEKNTFIYKNNDSKVTLYYQPLIYNNRFENNISLYRVDGYKENIFTPDFLIKIENKNKKISYIILDAKWQTIDNIKKYTLKEIIVKYCYSIADFNNNNYSEIILLQGKGENTKIYHHQNSLLSKQNFNFPYPKLTILPFTSEINNINYFISRIKNLIYSKN